MSVEGKDQLGDFSYKVTFNWTTFTLQLQFAEMSICRSASKLKIKMTGFKFQISLSLSVCSGICLGPSRVKPSCSPTSWGGCGEIEWRSRDGYEDTGRPDNLSVNLGIPENRALLGDYLFIKVVWSVHTLQQFHFRNTILNKHCRKWCWYFIFNSRRSLSNIWCLKIVRFSEQPAAQEN